MAKTVTVNGQKYQIGALGGIRKVGADGKPTGGVVSASIRAAINKKMSANSSNRNPKTNARPVGFMTDKPSNTVDKPIPKTLPKTKTSILSDLKKSFSLDNDIIQYMMKNTPGDALKQVITSNRAGQKSLVTKAKQEMKAKATGMGGSVDTRKPTAKPTARAVPTGMGDRKPKTPTKAKDAKNPNPAFNKSRAKQRLASKKLEKLSNKTVKDTSIKGLE